MELNQVYEFVNEATRQALGEEAIVNEDLSNIVDTGDAIFNASAVDKYVKALVNRIGRTVFVNRVYGGTAPDIMMDGWEFGSVLQKISGRMPEAKVNESWELEDGQSYDPHIFHQPKGIQVKFFNKYITFEVDMSFTEDQIKMSFTSAQEMNGFISMIYTDIENTMTMKIDELKRRTLNNIIGETIYDDYKGAGLSTKSGVKAINLLYLYNQEGNKTGTPLTADKAIFDPEFIRYASYKIKMTHDHMRAMSVLFNIGKQQRFTPNERCKIALLSDFARSADVYLQSDTFHDEFTKLPQADVVPYWQGEGQDFEFDSTSKIDVITSENHTVQTTGILCILYDRYSCAVTNVSRKVTSEYTASAEFFTNFYKYKAGYLNDFNENFVVFFIA